MRQWDLTVHLIDSLEKSFGTGITATRLLNVIKRFSNMAADQMANEQPRLAEKLRQATTHWVDIPTHSCIGDGRGTHHCAG